MDVAFEPLLQSLSCSLAHFIQSFRIHPCVESIKESIWRRASNPPGPHSSRCSVGVSPASDFHPVVLLLFSHFLLRLFALIFSRFVGFRLFLLRLPSARRPSLAGRPLPWCGVPCSLLYCLLTDVFSRISFSKCSLHLNQKLP